MNANSLSSGRRRHNYTPQFKVEMVMQCLQCDVLVAVYHGMVIPPLNRSTLK